jgi:hypothetical protein
LTPHADGTTFERELVYTLPNLLLRLLDRLVLRRRIEAESAEALRRLKDLLETRAAWNHYDRSRPGSPRGRTAGLVRGLLRRLEPARPRGLAES